MTVSVYDAANRIVKKSGGALSNLEIQKLLFIAHMIHLGSTGNPLIREHFEAWDYGPVQPSLYHKLKVFGSSPVTQVLHRTKELADHSDAARILDNVVDELGNHTVGWLVAATHRQNGAWARNYKPGAKGIVIPNQDIAQEYSELVNA